MSVCGEFAEHVWKPGSCKNCFHPRSAHRAIGGGGSLPAVCLRNSLGGEDEDGLTSPSPYTKPTIAVRPTMMLPDAHGLHANVNMNIEQERQKSPVDRLALKKLLNLSPLYIDKDGCSKALRETVLLSPSTGTKRDYANRFYSSHLSPLSPPVLPKDPVVISNIFVTQEQGGRGGSSVQENGSGDVYRQQVTTTTRTIKSTYNGSLSTRASSNNHEVQATVGIPLSINIITNNTSTAHGNAASSTVPASTSPETLDSVTQSSNPAILRSPTSMSELASLSDSSSSYRSSTDSLLGPEVFVGGQMKPDFPQSPQASSSPPSGPHSPEGLGDTEPIYAESTKRKRRPQMSVSDPQLQSLGQSQSQDQQQQHSELETGLIGEGQRAKITVMAAHTEENNRTFYLTSPDSAVSTQWPHFSPTTLKDPSSPAFHWPSQNIRRPSTETTTTSPPPNQLTPQSSPPIPPKRNSRSPKLGTSSLSSPVSLPELPVLVLLPSKDAQGKPQVEGHSLPSERRHNKPHGGGGPGWNWEGCIQEEEEDEAKREGGTEELVRGGRSLASPRATGMVNGDAVHREPKDRRMATSSSSLTSSFIHRASPTTPRTEPGTTTPLPATVVNNGASQGPIWSIAGAHAAAAAEEEGKHSGIMLVNAAAGVTLAGAAELAAGKGAASQEASAPPPPPKKHLRVFGKLGGSSMELDRCSQQGSVESLTQSLRGLGSASLPSASTDSLPGDTRALSDTGSHDARLNCSSPFPRSPMASQGSPYPDPLQRNNLSYQLQPPPLPEKKMVNRTVSAPDAAGARPFVRAYPRLPFTGSESSVCRPGDFGSASRSSLPSSPVDPRPLFSSSESLEHCHAPMSRPSRSRTLDEPLQNRGRLGVHCRGSLTCSSSPQLSVPFSASGLASAPGSGSSLQLQTLLSNIDSREGVYSKLGGLYAESLRRLALKCEDHFTRSQKNPLRFDESNWSLFKLTCNKPSCNTGDAVYYSAACASDPSNSYAVKICKSSCGEAKQGHLYGLSVQQSMPPHFNIQQDSGHFIACVPQSMLPSDEASLPSSNPPASSQSQPQSQPPSPDQADRERVVVITRDVPHQSAADFVREWAAFHQAQPEVYERRVCFLLLQLCNGLEHLKEHGVTYRDLCLENLLLVTHPSQQLTLAQPHSQANDQRHLPRLLISNFAKAKRRSSEDAASAHTDPRFRRDHARLAPEIVSAAQYRKFDEFQAGILIYELLHQPNPFEVSPALREQDYRCQDLPAIPAVSLYSAGLQGLARLLLQPDPIKRIHIQEAKRVLQSLLWGPRRDLMEQQWERQGPGVGGDGSRHEGLLNWLDVKRALLMMKFAERSLEPERNAELEDWLCCQYFSSAHPLSLCNTAELMYSLK